MSETQRDRATDQDEDIPDWPDRCRECLKANGCDPDQTLWCPPDLACPYYPWTFRKRYD